MYRAHNEDQEFKFIHVFSKLEPWKKWRKFLLALDKAKETYNLDAHAPAAAEGCPDGTKKARAARDATPAVERLQSSIKRCIADAKKSFQEGGEIRRQEELLGGRRNPMRGGRR
ncbi:putative methionyl-tRNA synthetase [Hordeum vulgare]|nr:putative methionyl-tRNA synthetase [Hordeum vulgare]